jgi:hypothetical protein
MAGLASLGIFHTTIALFSGFGALFRYREISPNNGLGLIYLVMTFAVLATIGAVPARAADSSKQKHPDVLEAKVRARGPGTFDFDVTVSSPYDTPQRYADAFRVMGKDGTVFGERKLLHDHAGEQPFTRDLHGVTIPRGVRSVIVQARDQKYGYGGKTFEVALPGR